MEGSECDRLEAYERGNVTVVYSLHSEQGEYVDAVPISASINAAEVQRIATCLARVL